MMKLLEFLDHIYCEWKYEEYARIPELTDEQEAELYASYDDD